MTQIGKIVSRGLGSLAPDWGHYLADGAGSSAGLIRVRRPHWPEGSAIEIPASGVEDDPGAQLDVRFHQRNRQLPFASRKAASATGQLGAAGGGVNAAPTGLWQQSEGFPWLTGGSIVTMVLPNFAGELVIDPGFPSLYQRRIGWSGMIMATSGSESYLLYLSTRWNDSGDPSSTDAIGIRINVLRMSDQAYVSQCDINFDAPFVSDPTSTGWRMHRLGSFFYDPQDYVITIALPMGLLSLNLAQAFVSEPDIPEFTLTAWPTDADRPSKDLSVSVAWNYALHHGWHEQDSGTPGPALRGYRRNRGALAWAQLWTAPISSLCSSYTPALVLGSGQVDRYGGYYQENNRALFLQTRQRWVVGITVIEDAAWGGERLASGVAAVVINTLSPTTGAVVDRWALENDATRLEIVESSEAAFIASKTASLAAAETAQMTALETIPRNPFAFPPDGFKPTSVVGFDPGAGTIFQTAAHITYLPSTPEISYPAGRPGVVLPAPSFADDSVTPSYLPYNGKVRLVSGDDGKLYTILFRARDIVTGYVASSLAEPDMSDVHWVAEYIGEEFSGYRVWVREPLRVVPSVAVDYETILVCLDDTLAELWRKDISLKFLATVDAVLPTPVWRNVWCWSARGRVMFVLRDYYPAATEGAELAVSYYEPVLEIYRLSDQALLHRISFSLDASHAHYNAVPRLTTGRIPSTEDEWAWAECNDVSSTVCMRVQMGADLTDAPAVVRSTHGGTGGGSDAPIGLEFEHAVQHDGRFYWPADFGAVNRST